MQSQSLVSERPPTQRITATRRVLESLRTKIIRAEYRPGMLLLEPELAAEYGVSKTPTREALQILAAEGLVTVIPRRGYYVSTVSFHSFREAMELRVILEPPLTAIAAVRRTPEQLEELERLLEVQFDADSTLGDRLDAATAFHLGCVRASENSLASSLVDTLFTAVQRLHHLNPAVEGHFDSEEERKDHYAILRAIADRDSAQAETLMRKHLVDSNQSIGRAFLGHG